MALPVSVPYSFANATTTQNLAYLDSNFNTLSYTLNAIGNGTVSLANVNITGGTISANVSSTSIYNGTSNVSVNSSNGPVSINTNGSNAMYIDASQNVGIGTTSPYGKLMVTKAALSSFTGTDTGAIFVSDSTNTINYYSTIDFTTANNSGLPLARIGMKYTTGGSFLNFGTSNIYASGITNTAMSIDPSGNLLVGTTIANPAGATYSGQIALVSAGGTTKTGINVATTATTSKAIEFQYTGFGVIGSISTTTTATAYNTSSDYRLKHDVQPMTNGLTTIGALKPVTYKWNADDSDGEGFIAHELQDVIPHAVTGIKDAVDDEGRPLHQGVDYSKIVVHLVAALQEAVAKIDDLSAEVTALKAKVG